jgi:hypothetical protein
MGFGILWGIRTGFRQFREIIGVLERLNSGKTKGQVFVGWKISFFSKKTKKTCQAADHRYHGNCSDAWRRPNRPPSNPPLVAALFFSCTIGLTAFAQSNSLELTERPGFLKG